MIKNLTYFLYFLFLFIIIKLHSLEEFFIKFKILFFYKYYDQKFILNYN